MDAVNATDQVGSVVLEEVAMVEEEVVMIWISPKTSGTLLILKIFVGISKVRIGVIFRVMLEHVLDVNTALQRLVADVKTTLHTADVAVAE